MNRIQSENHNIGSYRISKTSLPSKMMKSIYLKMDIVDYHVFTNLFVNHIKSNFCQIQKICFNFRSSQSSYFVLIFFPRFEKLFLPNQ